MERTHLDHTGVWVFLKRKKEKETKNMAVYSPGKCVAHHS